MTNGTRVNKMVTTAAKTKKGKSQMPLNWYDLARDLALRPIHSDKVHRVAIRVLGRLASLDRMTKEQGDYFEVLASLVEDYEKTQWPIDTSRVTVIDTLQFLIEHNNMTASDLGRKLGDRTLGHKLLTGKRKLTTAQVRKLADHFRVSTDVLI
jgi:HTH-type transcriptional regulator/antitoxin HigA